MKLKLTILMFLLMVSGCHTTQWRLDNVKRITEANPAGFADAVNASVESETFVRECLKVIVDLEYQLERK